MTDSGFDPQDNAPFNERVISEFRANKGRVNRAWLDKDLVLITTTGAKSGKPRVNPLVYVADGDRVVVAASNSGLDRHPAWYFNVRANPELTVERGEETYRAVASELTGPERDTWYARLTEADPAFTTYETRTSRRIPVFRLVRTTGA
ncbi:nitroreductase family deazaflavin-dependent oxidoreductase [Streptomyces olivaceus]|uniref:Nitroreductase family deazaflavin-dependent oxidoreductase n=1 Tax=Streptomyces olivaceus TaxID=47716 RepID=A0ABS7W6T3_STROV|nr:nitroreductase/quinone reductase family protein [Streptomyces olivaceus]MBZ6091275.1 nitroreductase family deazaflavin-dependent oxidoreductase [Streptomyces olivaceus]MBZ6097806.1 nitroreductase family deazaflavin-dependent oxidoreductase [Streptomyces olivaceus]MBZ6118245.1 nitroreductase family deazaflavin-dependent oxidoreductase [Streptomyces olivaceus]MBZ6153677.1 nitroreductase family deazaflavin-dependent oxidoreductase [Streptomyces olivaceus]MBZ6202077.1 nitroreductase family deaz